MALPDINNSGLPPLVLLHEREYMVRKTFGLFALETNLATVIESSDISQTKDKLGTQSFDLIILGFENWLEEIHVIQLVRNNMTLSKKNIPIIVILPNVTSSGMADLKELDVSEIILKPARIKTIQRAFKNIYQQV